MLWDEQRSELDLELRKVSGKLAGVYRRAIRLLDETPSDGEELVRVALIGHCMRELMNRLPDVLKDVPGMLRPVKPSAANLRDELMVVLARTDSFVGTAEFTSVPTEVIDAVIRFAAAVGAERARSLEKDSVAVAQARNSNSPAVAQWTEARAFFMDFVHLDSRVSDDGDASRLPTDEEMIARLTVVETALRSRLRGFFPNRRELDLRLAVFNEIIDEEVPDA